MQLNKQPRRGQQKKKNTYVLKLSGIMANPQLFQLCRTTPLPVITKNGAAATTPNGWVSGVPFPNPCAISMHAEYEKVLPYMGNKMASTVIEYLDKENGKPVLMLFPTTCHIFDGYEDDYMKHLNHASRRDFERQIKMREQCINKMLEDQRTM